MAPASEHCWDHGMARRVHPCGAPARCVRRCSIALPADLLQRCRNGGRGGVSADNERLQCAVTPGPADDTARGQISCWSSTIHRWTSVCTVLMTYAGFVSIRFDPAPADHAAQLTPGRALARARQAQHAEEPPGCCNGSRSSRPSLSQVRGVLRESSAACAARALPGGAAAVSAAGGRRTRSLPAGTPPVGCRQLVYPE